MRASHASHPRLQPHYADLEGQAHAARLGMWLFLASEVLLFSALFVLYASHRVADAETFRAAARHTSFELGAVMTGVLITSSLTVALALGRMREGRARASLGWLVGSLVLGGGFLGIKAVEYADHAAEGLLPGMYYAFGPLPEPAANAFFTLYYLMTGLHALHVGVGLVVLASVALGVARRRYDATYHTPLELGALYWHLVDMIWIFLWPVFYLLR